MRPSNRPLSLHDLRPDLLRAGRPIPWWRRVDWIVVAIVVFLLICFVRVMFHAYAS